MLEVSVFLSFDFDGMADNAGVIQSHGQLFEAVTHGESVRASDSEFESELTPHPLHYGRICEDFVIDDGSRVVRSGHKLGGFPFIQDTGEGLPIAVAQAYEEGFFQIVQIDFPGARDGPVKGNWPFAGGVFHLLGCEPLEECLWRGFWEY